MHTRTLLTLTRLTLVAFVATVVLACLSMTPAHAGGGDNCVKWDEFVTAPWAQKQQVEKFWGTGPGRKSKHVFPTSPGQVAYDYPSCDGGITTAVYRERSWQSIGYFRFS